QPPTDASDPTRRDPSVPGPATGGPGGPRASRWVMALIFLAVLLVWNVILFFPFGSPSAAAIPYSVFVAQAREGNIARVAFSAQGASGELVKPILWPQAAGPGASPAPSGAAAANPPASYQRFATVVPPDGDPTLLPLLEQPRGRLYGAGTDNNS